MNLSTEEIQFVRDARAFLENPSFLIRAANVIGRPLDRGLRLVPARAREKIQEAVRLSMEKGLKAVTRTISAGEKSFSSAEESSRKSGALHTAVTFGTGALGGFFGLASLPLELPITTAIMLRSIASIARDFGHDVSAPDVQLECLYVLSLGAEGPVGESAYWASRLAFTDLIRQAAREIEKSSAPFLIRFLAQVAARFELVVSEKAMAEVVPIIGALGGGIINAAFSAHFNTAARFHFGLRALETKYGSEVVRETYG